MAWFPQEGSALPQWQQQRASSGELNSRWQQGRELLVWSPEGAVQTCTLARAKRVLGSSSARIAGEVFNFFLMLSGISGLGFAYWLVKINVFETSGFLPLQVVLKTPLLTRTACFSVMKSWNCLRKEEIAGEQKKWWKRWFPLPSPVHSFHESGVSLFPALLA